MVGDTSRLFDPAQVLPILVD
ncbi:MAG: hypothetical protein RIS70_2356, partial [Planctomycetota bacterium]